MQSTAHEIGYSETVFAAAVGNSWRVRYFSPESEVPFCGHATIALGTALALEQGDGFVNFDYDSNMLDFSMRRARCVKYGASLYSSLRKRFASSNFFSLPESLRKVSGSYLILLV